MTYSKNYLIGLSYLISKELEPLEKLNSYVEQSVQELINCCTGDIFCKKFVARAMLSQIKDDCPLEFFDQLISLPAISNELDHYTFLTIN